MSWDRRAGTGIVTGPDRWLWALDSSAKSKKQRGSTEAFPLPLRCLSQFFPQMAPTDVAFFNQNWARACWDRYAGTGIVTGPVRWLWTLDSSAKSKKQRGLVGAFPLPLRCLSQFFPQTAQTDDAFFNRNWVGACWDRWAGT